MGYSLRTYTERLQNEVVMSNSPMRTNKHEKAQFLADIERLFVQADRIVKPHGCMVLYFRPERRDWLSDLKNKAEMLIKEKEPGRIFSLTETTLATSSIKQLVVAGNATIAKHNDMVDNYTAEKNSLIADIWAFLMDENEALIAGYLNDIENFAKAKKGIQKGIDICKQQLDDLDNKIIEAEKNITSVQPTVDEINRSLKSYRSL